MATAAFHTGVFALKIIQKCSFSSNSNLNYFLSQAGSLLARNWFKKNDEFDLKWIGGMKIGQKVYGKQESVKSQDFPPGEKIGSKMAPVNKIFLKVPEIKN